MQTRTIKSRLKTAAAITLWRVFFLAWRVIEARQALDSLRGDEDGDWT